MNEPQLTQQAALDDCTIKDKTRRCCLGLFSGAFLSMFGGCKDDQAVMPTPPYGRALDVTKANTFVEFDFRVEKPDRYDVVLEVFENALKETGPLSDVSKSHFKVRIQSLSVAGEMVLDREVIGDKKPHGLFEKSFGPSRTEKTDLMSRHFFLIKELPLDKGTHHIRCDNLNALPALQDRLVKVTVELMHYPK